MAISAKAPPPKRDVSLMLKVGVFFLPIVFVWFLLRRGYSNVARLVGFGWLVVFLIATAMNRSPQTATSTTEPSSAAAVLGQPASTEWSYDDFKDQMRGTSTHLAHLQSENQLAFGFPYHGGYTTLTLRKKPKGADAFLEVSGQFLCNEYAGDSVAVKFDTGPIQHFTCENPQDARTGMLFIEPASRLIAEIRKAKTMTIEAQFFQAGRHQMTFDVRSFDWK